MISIAWLTIGIILGVILRNAQLYYHRRAAFRRIDREVNRKRINTREVDDTRKTRRL